ncbi:MAG: VWA domain-containing protein [Alphaproteobacteria bacterium]
MSGAPVEGLALSITRFVRLLRGAGFRLGPGAVIDALDAVQTVGLKRRDDVYAALHATCVSRREQDPLFDEAFRVFWRDTGQDGLVGELPDEGPSPAGREISPRLADALLAAAGRKPMVEREPRDERPDADAVMTYSDREILRQMDFAKMTSDEEAAARRALARAALLMRSTQTRRFQPARRGPRIDMRRALRGLARPGGELAPPPRQRPRLRRPPIVVLCDISGSMERYTRIFLHFLHALTNDQDRIQVFLFGTRLSNVTRQLRHRDVDVALDRVTQSVTDWAGGTRIGRALHDFNRRWSRRVLGQRAIVLLITDGLDRDAGDGLATEIERVHLSSDRLIWLNPLLRFAGFEPKSLGIRAMLPHVDEFRPAHNLASLDALANALADPPPRQRPAPRREKRA